MEKSTPQVEQQQKSAPQQQEVTKQLVQEGHLALKWNLNLELIQKSVQFHYYRWDGDETSEMYPCTDPKYLELLLPSFKSDSSSIKIKHKNYGDSYNSYYSSFYLNSQLDNSKTYIVKLSLNQSCSYSYLHFGLISKQNKDIHTLYENNIDYWDMNGGSTNKVLKGRSFAGASKKSKELQLKFNISKKIWRVSTLPDHLNILGLKDQNSINISQDYFLTFQLTGGASIQINEILEILETDGHV